MKRNLVERNTSVLKIKLFFISAGKKLGTSWAYCVLDKPEKLQANFSLKHCHVFSHTAPPTRAKNLSNYLSSGKPSHHFLTLGAYRLFPLLSINPAAS